MSLFISNNLIGWIGGFYEKMTPAEFWAMHSAIAAGGAFLLCCSVAASVARSILRNVSMSSRSDFSILLLKPG
jgi:hypothetical protein